MLCDSHKAWLSEIFFWRKLSFPKNRIFLRTYQLNAFTVSFNIFFALMLNLFFRPNIWIHRKTHHKGLEIDEGLTISGIFWIFSTKFYLVVNPSEIDNSNSTSERKKVELTMPNNFDLRTTKKVGVVCGLESKIVKSGKVWGPAFKRSEMDRWWKVCMDPTQSGVI